MIMYIMMQIYVNDLPSSIQTIITFSILELICLRLKLHYYIPKIYATSSVKEIVIKVKFEALSLKYTKYLFSWPLI